VIVLDTHALVWFVDAPGHLTRAAEQSIRRADRIGVPAIAPWEIGMLVRRKRIALDRDVLAWVEEALARPRFELLALTPSIAVLASQLDALPDPSDRLIAATAVMCDAPLITKDERIRRWEGVRTIW
jgi:PIN domain nuclease of toxin-antitoxin system